jgi:hypothetical protein
MLGSELSNQLYSMWIPCHGHGDMSDGGYGPFLRLWASTLGQFFETLFPSLISFFTWENKPLQHACRLENVCTGHSRLADSRHLLAY